MMFFFSGIWGTDRKASRVFWTGATPSRTTPTQQRRRRTSTDADALDSVAQTSSQYVVVDGNNASTSGMEKSKSFSCNNNFVKKCLDLISKQSSAGLYKKSWKIQFQYQYVPYSLCRIWNLNTDQFRKSIQQLFILDFMVVSIHFRLLLSSEAPRRPLR